MEKAITRRADVLIVTMNASDRDRIVEVREELSRLVSYNGPDDSGQKLRSGVPILILLTKQDLPVSAIILGHYPTMMRLMSLCACRER